MPTRILREGILTSDRVDQLSEAAELFYRRLMSRVDDHGIHDARPSILLASLYPLRIDRVTVINCTQMLTECVTVKLLYLFEFESKPYLQMLDTNWQHRSIPRYGIPANILPYKSSCTSVSNGVLKSYTETSTQSCTESRAEAESGAESSSKPSNVKTSSSLNPLASVSKRARTKVKSTATGSSTPAAGEPKAAPPQKQEPAGNAKANAETWAAYANAYEERYDVPPVRNAKSNAIVDQLVKRLGASEAPAVAAFYCRVAKWSYVEAKHPLTLLLRDAEGIRTEWVTNRPGTRTEAQAADRKQANTNTFGKMIEEAEQQEGGGGIPPADLARHD